jgi:uncharacterized protein YndB with AHSA1/START domain
MADIAHEIKIKAPRDRVFDALATLDGLRSWHTTRTEGSVGVGGVLQFESAGNPKFRWEITRLDAPKHLEWKCVEGPGDSVGTMVRYDLSDTTDGRILVELAHSGWPGTHGNYRKCNTLWGILLHHLKMHAETGRRDPAFV